MDVASPLVFPPLLFTGAFSLAANMAGATLIVTSSSAVTVTVPAGLPAGFACTIVQGGSGVVSVVGASGVTVHNPNGYFKTGGVYTVMGVIAAIVDHPILTGQLQA